MPQKILILKSGYSEFLFNKESNKPSLGDVLRITPILHLFKEDDVTWVTDKAAFPLLKENLYINRLLPFDFSTAISLLEEDFDVVVNLEKNRNICKFSNKINAWKKYGFRFDNIKNKIEAYDKAFEVLAQSSDINIKKNSKKLTQELIFELMGKKWGGEEYILGYKPKTKGRYDIGLNTKVGVKFPLKEWPIKYWGSLEQKLVREGFKVSRQDTQPSEVLNNLYKYMDWINSCKMIVTNDSLGLHLAIALKKKVIGLFGPTKSTEIYFYGRGKALLPKPKLDCVPCLNENGECPTGKNCMEKISIERVYKEILKENEIPSLKGRVS